jgi:hypothetical protein
MILLSGVCGDIASRKWDGGWIRSRQDEGTREICFAWSTYLEEDGQQ